MLQHHTLIPYIHHHPSCAQLQHSHHFVMHKRESRMDKPLREQEELDLAEMKRKRAAAECGQP